MHFNRAIWSAIITFLSVSCLLDARIHAGDKIVFDFVASRGDKIDHVGDIVVVWLKISGKTAS